MVVEWWFYGILWDYETSGVISHMAGWKIPELNRGFIRNITELNGPFSIAMSDYQRVGMGRDGW